jgi:hypothetical protein
VTPIPFGWLPIRISCTSPTFDITTHSQFDEAVKDVYESGRVDNDWYWPDIVDTPPRPAQLYALPVTHEITTRIIDPSKPEGDPNEEEKLAQFLLAVLGFLYTMLLTPEGWVHFYRVSINPRRWQDFFMKDEARTRILEKAATTWLRAPTLRDALFGALRWHTFSVSYEHAFERFMAQYFVLDACWSIHEVRTGCKRPPHAQRVQELATAYALQPPKQWSGAGVHDRLAHIRNELFHEAKWGGKEIGFGHPESPNESIHLDLFWFNSRLLLALLGEYSDYVHSKVVHQPFFIE